MKIEPKKIRFCNWCNKLNRTKTSEFCSLECKIEKVQKERTQELSPKDLEILLRQKRDGWNRKMLCDYFGVSDYFLSNLQKRADKHLTGDQIKELYGINEK